MTDFSAAPSASSAKTRLKPKLDAAGAAAHDVYDSLKDVAATAAAETREKVLDLTAQASERVERRYGDLEAWVQLRPVQALGVAAGLGVLMGLLLRGGSTKTIYLRDRP